MNARCDCISCEYEEKKSTEDPCRRCYHDSEYQYGGKECNSYPQRKRKDGWQDNGTA